MFSSCEVRLFDERARKNAEMAPFNSNGWTGRIRTCECWDQNPVPYRLATVQYTPLYHFYQQKTTHLIAITLLFIFELHSLANLAEVNRLVLRIERSTTDITFVVR